MTVPNPEPNDMRSPLPCMTNHAKHTPMPSESKMISLRVSVALVERVDFVARNIDSDMMASRSAVILTAIESWLPSAEDRLRALGVAPPKRK